MVSRADRLGAHNKPTSTAVLARALLAFFFVCVTSVPFHAHAETPIAPFPGNNAGSQVWSKTGSPYVVTGNVNIRFGSLTIEPGVVVKLNSGAILDVHASVPVSIQGTEAEPIYFTSIKDDAFGGDTNADGSLSVPASGDWGYLSFGSGSTNSSMQLRYLKIRYGGGVSQTVNSQSLSPALIVSYPWFNGRPGIQYQLSNIEVAYSPTGLMLSIGRQNSVTLSGSSFRDASEYGVYKVPLFNLGSDNTGSLNLNDNWWGDVTGPYHSLINQSGAGSEIGGNSNVVISSWLLANPLPDPVIEPQYAECCSSVLFLPGFEGSILKSGDNTLWPPTLFDVTGDLEKLSFNNGSPTVPGVQVEGILDEFVVGTHRTPIYKEFSEFMDGLTAIDISTGTSTINEWLPFGYDWRFGPEYPVLNPIQTTDGEVSLIEKVEALAERSQTGKVIIVAHSMGGLVGKALIKQLTDSSKAELIDSFVMVGTPQLGTPQALAGLLHGEGSDISTNIFGYTYSFVNKGQARELGKGIPGSYVLLPSQKYFSEVSDPVLSFAPTAPNGMDLIATFGESVRLYQDMVSFMTGDLVPLPTPDTGIFKHYPARLDSNLISSAKDYHDEYDSYAYPSNIRVVEVVGWGLQTIKGLRYVERHGKLAYDPMFTTEGDATVVYPSAKRTSNGLYLNLYELNRANTARSVNHLDLMSAAPVNDLVNSVVRKIHITSPYFSEVKPPIDVLEDSILVSTHSPVSLSITDTAGNYTGLDPNQDKNADILINQKGIPGSQFFTFGDGSYVLLPATGQYSVSMQGTGVGSTTLMLQGISNDVTTNIATFTDFQVTENTKVNISILNSEPTTLVIDTDGNGLTDVYVAEDGGVLSLEELLFNLKTYIQGMNVKDKLKKELLKRIEKIEKKIAKNKLKLATKAVMSLEKKINKKGWKKRISDADVREVLNLLEQIENAI